MKPGNTHLPSERQQQLLIRAALEAFVCVWFIPATLGGFCVCVVYPCH